MTYRIFREESDRSRLRQHELNAFLKIAKFYQSDLKVLRVGIGKTPDIEIESLGTVWEVKSPFGNSKNTIENNFKQAKRQSGNIIIDLGRCKMRQDVAIRKVESYCLKKHKTIKHVKVLKKNGEIIDIC